MTKPFIKRKLFSTQPAGRPKPAARSETSEFLSLDFLDTVSCFETMRVYRGRVFRVREHLGRFRESCEGLGKKFPCPPVEMERFLMEALEESGYPDSIVRLSLHWPHAGLVETQNFASLLVSIVRPFFGHPKEWYEKGVDFTSTVLRRPSPRAQDPQLKVSQYVSGVLAHLDLAGARRAAPLQGFHEILFFGDTGTVAEGSVSNLFIARGRLILTPPASSGILKGVTRSVVLALACRRGLEVRETHLTRHELYNADECWMTNTSSEVLPVTRIDGRRIGDGRPGKITKLLAQDFKKEIR